MTGRSRLREVKLTLPMAPDMEVVASQAACSLAAFIGMSPDRVDEVRLHTGVSDHCAITAHIRADNARERL